MKKINALLPYIYFILLPGILLWPFPLHFFDRFIGEADAYRFTWDLWWGHYALTHGLNPFWNSLVYWPVGNSVFQHTHVLLEAFLAHPLFYFMQPVAIYNAMVWLNVAMAGGGTYLLTRRAVGPGIFPALLAGTFMAGCANMLMSIRNGHLNYISFGIVVLAIAALLWMEKARSKTSLAVAVIAVTLATFQYGLFFIFILFFWLFRLCWGFFAEPATWRDKAFLKWQAAYLLLVSLLSAPVIIATKLAGTRVMRNLEFSTDIISPLLPHPFHPVWGRWAWSVAEATQKHPWESSGYMTIIGILSATWFAFRSSDNEWKFWATSAWAFFALSLGPQLHLLGVHQLVIPLLGDHQIKIPFYFVYEVVTKLFPPLLSLRVSAAFMFVSVICVAVCLGFLARQVMAMRSHYKNILAAALFACVVLENLAVPYPVFADLPYRSNGFYKTLNEDKDDYVILELPLDPFHWFGRRSYVQIEHQHPTIGGYVSRPDYSHRKRWDADPLLGAIKELEEGGDASRAIELADPARRDALRASLKKCQIRYVALENVGDNFDRLKEFLNALPFLEKIYEEDNFIGWRVERDL